MINKPSKGEAAVFIAIGVAALIYVITKIDLSSTLVRVFVLLVCFPVHEFAHAFAAVKLGDDTPERQGRLSLNPLRHMTIEGTAMLLLFGFGFGKPVQFNPNNFPPEKRKAYTIITALAGPLSNILMALLFLVLFNLGYYKLQSGAASYFLDAAYINVSLAVFNMIPIPPLDGSHLLMAFIPEEAYYKLTRYRNVLIIAIFAASFILPRLGINLLGRASLSVLELLQRFVLIFIR